VGVKAWGVADSSIGYPLNVKSMCRRREIKIFYGESM
jgi:hypothetical protein